MRINVLLLSLGVVLLSVSSAYAIPVSLVLTIDDPTHGRAVLSGSVEDTFKNFPAGPTNVDFSKKGTNWLVEATIFRVVFHPSTGDVYDYDLAVKGQHLIKLHTGEVAPGLYIGGGLEVYHSAMSGEGIPGLQDDVEKLIHPGSVDHYDTLSSHLDDLNGGQRGYLTRDLQIADRIDLNHTPEPASSALLGTGLLGLMGFRRKVKK